MHLTSIGAVELGGDQRDSPAGQGIACFAPIVNLALLVELCFMIDPHLIPEFHGMPKIIRLAGIKGSDIWPVKIFMMRTCNKHIDRYIHVVVVYLNLPEVFWKSKCAFSGNKQPVEVFTVVYNVAN